MLDLIAPRDPHALTLSDLVHHKTRAQSGLLFDVLFNLHKFHMFETRDPFHEQMKREDGFGCDWDRFAFGDYQRLAHEESKYDGEGEGVGGGMEVDAGGMGGVGVGAGELSGWPDDDDDLADEDDDQGQLYAGRGLGGNRNRDRNHGSR